MWLPPTRPIVAREFLNHDGGDNGLTVDEDAVAVKDEHGVLMGGCTRVNADSCTGDSPAELRTRNATLNDRHRDLHLCAQVFARGPAPRLPFDNNQVFAELKALR